LQIPLEEGIGVKAQGIGCEREVEDRVTLRISLMKEQRTSNIYFVAIIISIAIIGNEFVISYIMCSILGWASTKETIQHELM
jgi:hypothetical protein